MAIGQGGSLGGLNLPVGININLTGQQQLTDLAKALDAINQMIVLTQRNFQSLSNTIRNMPTIPTGLSGASTSGATAANVTANRKYRDERGLGEFEEASRNKIQRTYVAAGKENERFDATKYINERGLAEFEESSRNKILRNEERLHREHQRVIQGEIDARQKSIDGFKNGIMGGLGVTAALGVSELVRTGIHAVGKLDERIAAMRLTGHSEEEIDRTRMAAARTPVHGVNMAERLFLGQEISGILGKEASAETSRNIAILARSTARITGQSGDITGATRNLLRGADAFGNIHNPKTGQLDEDLFNKNALAFQKMIALGQGIFTPQTLMHNARMATQPLQALDIANNPRAMARFAVLNESLGERAGETLNSVFRAMTTPMELSKKGAGILEQHGLLNTSNIMATPNLQGGNARLFLQDAIKGNGNFLDKAIEVAQKLTQDTKRLHPEFTENKIAEEVGGLINTVFGGQGGGVRFGRAMADLATPTGIDKTERFERRAAILGNNADDIDRASRNFNDSLMAVKASFEDLVGSFAKVGGLTNALYGFADAMSRMALFLNEHPKIAQFASDIALVIAALLGLRLAIAALVRLPGLARFAIGSTFAGATAGSVAASTAAGTAATVAGGAALGARVAGSGAGAIGSASAEAALAGASGGLLARGANAAQGIKAAGMGGVVNRGLMGFLITGVASAAVDGITDENSGTNELMKNALEGAGIGYAVGGLWGALIGALADVTLKAAHKGLTKSMIEKDDYAKQHPDETFVDPISGIAVTGLKNRDVHPPAPFNQADEDVREHAVQNRIAGTTETTTAVSARVNAPRVSRITRSPNDMRPERGTVKQTDFDSPLAHQLAGINQTQQQQQTANAFRQQGITPQTIPMPAGVSEIPGVGKPTGPLIPAIKIDTMNVDTLNVRMFGSTGGGAGAGKGGGGGGVSSGAPIDAQKNGTGIALTSAQGGLAGHTIGGNLPAGGFHGGGHSGVMSPATGGVGSIPTSNAPVKPLSTAEQKRLQNESMQFWQTEGGLNKHRAAGMTAQERAESGFNKNAIGDSGLARGSFQWHPDRQRAILAGTGIDVTSPNTTHLQMLQAAHWEMTKGKEQKAWAEINKTNTARESGAAGSLFYERPRDRIGEASRRGALATSIENETPNMGAPLGLGATTPMDRDKAMSSPNIQGPRVNPEQGDVPANNMHLTIHSPNYLDGERISEHVAHHIIGGGPTAMGGSTAFDPRMHPMGPGASIGRF
jgi:hypothetical protein